MRTMPEQKPGRSKQDYGTPPEFWTVVLDRLGIGSFDIDLAANDENTLSSRFYTAEDNALIRPWKIDDGWNWLNPPFGRIAPWVEKAYGELRLFRAQTAVLVPAAVGSNWWRDWVHEKAHVLFLNGRITFVGASDPYPKDCALLLYSVEEAADIASGDRAYSVWSWQ